ncbi:MAG TPA: hypothetical protein VIG73_05185 [Cerasibacillus sp.]
MSNIKKVNSVKVVTELGHEKSETPKIYADLRGKLRYDFYSKYF